LPDINCENFTCGAYQRKNSIVLNLKMNMTQTKSIQRAQLSVSAEDLSCPVSMFRMCDPYLPARTFSGTLFKKGERVYTRYQLQ